MHGDHWMDKPDPPFNLLPADFHYSFPPSSSTTMSSQIDEEIPLLHSQPKKSTPLPWGQLSMVLLIQLAEPFTSQVIYPFAPQVGFYLKRPDEF